MSPQNHDDALSEITHHLAVIQTYITRVAVLVAEQQGAAAPMPLHGSALRGSTSSVRSLQVWAEHLAEHGPTTRGDLFTATGLNLSTAGYDRTQAWVGQMAYLPDSAHPDDMVLRIKSTSSGKGRPPVIYFLWSSRWEVLPKFGFGPVKPDNVPDQSHLHLTGLTHDEAMEATYGHGEGDHLAAAIAEILSKPVPEALLGVIQPPISSHPIDPAYGDEQAFQFDGDPSNAETVAPPEPVRLATMEEWDARHAAYFDGLVASETKPTDDDKQGLYLTLPDGADRGAAIAIAYRQAVERSRG